MMCHEAEYATWQFGRPGPRRWGILNRPSAQTSPEGPVIAGLRERKRAANRAATVNVAYALFAERRYDQVTVADICAAADIAPRTFFRYFGGKEDVVAEPFRRLGEQILDAISTAPPTHSDAEALVSALQLVGRAVVADRERLSAFLTIVHGSANSSMARFLPLGQQEREIVQRLARRRPGPVEPDWRLRLLVAIHVAAYRVWFEEMIGGMLTDPDGHLAEIFAALRAPLPGHPDLAFPGA